VSEARLGWLGGTFDPIHCGHLDVAEAAKQALHLGTVFLVPANLPPHRNVPVASAEHRLEMVRLAAATRDWLRVSDIELTAPGPSFTTETLDRLQAQGTNLSSLHVITGADAFAEIFTWKGVPELFDRCPFVVVSRPGFPAPDLRQKLPALADRMIDAIDCDFGARPGIFLVDAPTAPVTATEIRTRAASQMPLDGLVPESVASYINRHELYQGVA
jgi:nicotinate-nucleotide adenylyltransferase